ncbi:MAG: hypothetical protein MUO76_16815 [Anaerolineaceae bacterium]|nr:hypothetical protein [Anaerolineaceae bacterium]
MRGVSRNNIWISRGLISLVLLINIQCALIFLSSPELYAPAFELGGVAGNAVIQGFGILFLMWNVPYFFAILHPQKNRISLFEAVLMQMIGLIGESILFLGFPEGHSVIQASIARFVIFDGIGLLILILSAWLTRLEKSSMFHGQV